MPTLRLGVVLHKERQASYQSYAAEIEAAARAATGVRERVRVEFSPSRAPADFMALMEGMRGRVDALAASAITHPDITEAVEAVEAVEALKADGIPTFALLNDFAQGVRHAYPGFNNLKGGRIAASLIAMAAHQPGKLAVFVGATGGTGTSCARRGSAALPASRRRCCRGPWRLRSAKVGS